MNLLFYSPQMEGHPQVYCRVLADIFIAEGHRVIIAGSGRSADWPREWTYLAPLSGRPSVEFVDTRRYSATAKSELHAEELRRLQEDQRIDSTLLVEGDYFADELRRIADGQVPRLRGRMVGIFARTSGWYPRENDYGGNPEPLVFGGGTRASLRRLRNLMIRRQESQAYFYRTVLLRRRAVDAVVVKDERVAERFGPPVHWMPEIFRVFDDSAAAQPSPDTIPPALRDYMVRAGSANLLLYFGTGARYKGYDFFLKLADLDPTTFALHAGAPLREVDRGQMLFDVEAIRRRLLEQGRLFETNGFVEDEALAQALFHGVDRFVSTHRLTLSSGTMLQALDAGRPVLTAATGQVGHRTRIHRLGMTYRYGDAENLRDQWVAFRRTPVADYIPHIHAYMGRFSRDAVADTFRSLLIGTGASA